LHRLTDKVKILLKVQLVGEEFKTAP
jgi:hypothetical protein